MKFFKWVKEIRSKEGILHFKRFAIFESKLFSIYIHKIYQADKDPFCHTHPWNAFSVILKGSYIELVQKQWTDDEFYDCEEFTCKTKRFLSLGFINRKYLHKLYKIISPATTLFITFGEKRPWGFMTKEGLIDSEEYIKNKNKYNKSKS